MDTQTEIQSQKSSNIVQPKTPPDVTCTQADFLRTAADRRERRGETVTALLFRNEAWRLENC